MKKLLFGVATILLIVSCSGNGASEKAREDAARIADSIAKVEAEQAAAEQARLDSLRQDSIAKAQSLQANSAEVEKMITEFYECAVLSGCKRVKKIPRTRSALSKYCTKSFIKRLARAGAENDIDMYGYSTGESFAVWILRNPYIQDSDSKDKVLSVEVGDDDTATVTYLDCGVRSKTKLYMKNDNGIWKINDCKFLR